jgi:hypothetical protein
VSRAARGLLAALVCLPLLAGGAPTARAAVPEGAGWWWRVQTGVLVDVPPPEHVPPGGLSVASAPDGPVAIAAARFRLGADEADPVLTLVVAEDRGGEGAVLQACAAVSSWLPSQAGRWEDRPEADCAAAAVEVERAEDGGTWSFPLAALASGGRVDIVILPGELTESPVAGSPSFELAFEPVDATSLSTTTAGDDGGTGPGPSSDTDEGPLVFTPDPGGEEGAAEDDQPPWATSQPEHADAAAPFASSAPFTPSAPQTAPAPEVDDAGNAVPQPQAAGAEEEPGATAQAPMRGGAPEPVPAPQPAAAQSAGPSGIGLLLVVLCMGAGMLLSGGEPRQPQALGAFAQRRGGPPPVPAETRGIGRFAKAREGRPPSLR